MTKKKMPPRQRAALTAHGFQPGGPSPNPGGRPRQHKEMVTKLRTHADWIADAILALIHKGLTGKLTMSDKILSQHLWECWQAMFGRHPQSMLLTGGLDVGDDPANGTAGLSALLQRAQLAKQKRATPSLEPPREAPAEIEPVHVEEGEVLMCRRPPPGFAPWPATPPPPASAAAPFPASPEPPDPRPLKPEPPYQGRDVTPKAPLAPKYNGMPDDAVAPEEVMATSPEPSRAPPFDPDPPPKAAPPPPKAKAKRRRRPARHTCPATPNF